MHGSLRPMTRMRRRHASWGSDIQQRTQDSPARSRPGDWLEYSPLCTLFIAALGLAWLVHEFGAKGAVATISNLNTYNFIFLASRALAAVAAEDGSSNRSHAACPVSRVS